jgi:hypothetical protein
MIPQSAAFAASIKPLASGSAGAAVADETDVLPASAGPSKEDGETLQICPPITGEALDQLLLGRYNAKYNRMGLPGKMPGRSRWKKLEAAEAQAAAARALAAGVTAEAVEGAAASRPLNTTTGASNSSMRVEKHADGRPLVSVQTEPE